MTLTLSRYGQMDKLGEMHVPRVGSSPVDILLSAYTLLKQVIPPYTAPGLNYLEAVRLLAPHRISLESVTQGTFDIFSSKLASAQESEYLREMGVFISAAFNLSGLAKLVDTGHEGIGYRLAEGKQLIVNNKNRLVFVGEEAAGDIALLGDAVMFADGSRSGFQVSWGDTSGFANLSTGGIKINCNNSTAFGIRAKGCFLVSYSPVGSFGSLTEEVVLLNYDAARFFGYDTKQVFKFDEGHVSFHPDSSLIANYFWKLQKDREIRKLLEGVRTLKAVAGMRDRPAKALAMVNAYDWKGLEVRLRATMNGDGRG